MRKKEKCINNISNFNFFFFLQGISPGLVATELMVSYSTYSEEALASFPTLDPEDVATAAIYILSCAPHVVVSIIIHT